MASADTTDGSWELLKLVEQAIRGVEVTQSGQVADAHWCYRFWSGVHEMKSHDQLGSKVLEVLQNYGYKEGAVDVTPNLSVLPLTETIRYSFG